jgi:hypothetical protein
MFISNSSISPENAAAARMPEPRGVSLELPHVTQGSRTAQRPIGGLTAL